jgi:hypothetical protein
MISRGEAGRLLECRLEKVWRCLLNRFNGQQSRPLTAGVRAPSTCILLLQSVQNPNMRVCSLSGKLLTRRANVYPKSGRSWVTSFTPFEQNNVLSIAGQSYMV